MTSLRRKWLQELAAATGGGCGNSSRASKYLRQGRVVEADASPQACLEALGGLRPNGLRQLGGKAVPFHLQFGGHSLRRHHRCHR